MTGAGAARRGSMRKLLAPEVEDHGWQRSAAMPPDPPAHGGEHSCRGAQLGASAGAGGAAKGDGKHMRAEKTQVRADPCRGVLPLFCHCALCASLSARRLCGSGPISRFGSLVAAVVDA